MILKANLEALSNKNPKLHTIIENTPITNRYTLVKSSRSDGLPTLIHNESKRDFYTKIDPVQVVMNDLNSRNIRLGELFVILGFGLGYEVNIIKQTYPSSKIIIIEKDPEVLKIAFSTRDLTNIINDPYIIFVGCEPIRLSYPEMFNFLKVAPNMYYLKSVNIIEQPIAFTIEKDYYIESIRLLKEALQQAILLYGNDPSDSLIGIKFTLRNIPTIIDNPGINDLKGVFKGKPGIVVASGPSLNKNIHLLKGLKDKAVICAADGSVKILKHHGIEPAHLVSSLERGIETSYLFEGLTEEDTKDSYLAACPVVVPETYEAFPGKKIIVYRQFATFEWLNIDKGILDIGPSAGNMAFNMLEYLGCDPIILIGQDLSIKDDFTSHAEGFQFGEKVHTEELKRTLIKVEGNYQDTVYSDPFYKMFILTYEKDLQKYKGTCINATEGGAKIHGTTLMTFQEAIDKYIKEDFYPTKVIQENLKEISFETKIKQMNLTISKLKDAIKYCNKLIDKANEALKEIEKIYKILRETNNNPEGDDIKKVNKKLALLNNTLHNYNDHKFYLIGMHYVQSYFIHAAQDLNAIKFNYDDSNDRNVLLINKLREIFSVMNALIEKLVVEFKISLEILEKHKESTKQ